MTRIGNKPPAQPKRTEEAGGRFASPQARQAAISSEANKLIEGGKVDFTERAPKKADIAREFTVRNVRPFTYTALEMKNGDIILKKVLTGGFVPARPGDGSFSKPIKMDILKGGRGAPTETPAPKPRTNDTVPTPSTRPSGTPARAAEISQKANSGIASGSYQFNAGAPKQSDVAREIPVRNVRPFTYTALELKNGDIVLKKLLTGGFAPPQPGDGSFTKPMKLEDL